MTTKYFVVATFVFFFLFCSNQAISEYRNISVSAAIINDQSLRSNSNNTDEPIKPIPQTIDIDLRKVALGRKLFEDKQLSSDGTMACRSCHYIEKGGSDGESLSKSIDGGFRNKNTPSIFNVGLYDQYGLYGWYGMSTSLEDLAETIIKSKKGLATDWPALIPLLNKDPEYLQLFNSSYVNGVKPENVKNALAEYMRSLITPDSRFDKYLRGDEQAINKQEKEGYRLFKSYGCSSCHQGIAVGGNMVAPFNIFKNFLDQDEAIENIELGRFSKTKVERDKYVFRVPSLRNVELTGPYMHDGSVKRLEVAIDVMGRYMLGRKIPVKHRERISQFLKTLTGQYQGKPL